VELRRFTALSPIVRLPPEGPVADSCITRRRPSEELDAEAEGVAISIKGWAVVCDVDVVVTAEA
jgi:hypothetical protein